MTTPIPRSRARESVGEPPTAGLTSLLPAPDRQPGMEDAVASAAAVPRNPGTERHFQAMGLPPRKTCYPS